ncbi:hypothetical protein DHX103_02430 [Planococcus sp. X10-3]|uniref:hypothetical protein n=1 Tax=Planococcus sp. X10-3 TaxID=3061240 RepID=UPI003BB09789
MNKKLFLAASVLAVGGLMAACGSDETSEGTTEESSPETVEEQNDPATSDDSTEEDSAEDDSDSGESTEESEEPAEEPAETNPALTEGTPTVSDSNSYEIYLLPSFELTAEEPNKDVVFSTENDALFMRVETFSPDEADFAYAQESIQQTIQASNDSAELTELPAFEEAEFINSSVYEIPTDNGKVTGVAYEKDGLIVKLTIFDLTEAAVTEDFLNMGKTITAK